MIRKGMTIILKSEYRDPGDENLTFIALTDEEKGRLDVGIAQFADWTVPPVMTVTVEMIQSAK
jgi:hypothetical protein